MSAKLEGFDSNSGGVSFDANSNVITDPLGNKTPTENLCDQASGEGSRVIGNTETLDTELDMKLDNIDSQTDCNRIAGGSCLDSKVDETATKASVDLGVDDVELVHSRGEEGVLDSSIDRTGISHDMDLDTQQKSVDEVVSINETGSKVTESRDDLDEENVSVAVNCVSDAATFIEEASLNGDPKMVSEGQLTVMKPEDADGKDIKHAASNIEGCVEGSRTEEEGVYNMNDLVWGKVSGHPWWPGQIFEPSAASRKAMKYFKKDSYLIAYFGDHTFAWNDVSRIKPFRMYFNQMEKQSYTEAFCSALDCVLDEVSRRVEFGLSCRCLPEEMQAKFKSQNVVNRGIRKESCQREGGDDLSTASSFSPAVLIKHLKSLATSQCDGVDRLGFVVARAQLLAFNRWNGYDELSEMGECGGLLENDGDIHVSQGREEEVPGWSDDDRAPSGNEKEIATKSSVKRRQHSGNNKRMAKKVKSTSGSGKNGKEKTDRKVNILSSGNKHKASDLIMSDVKVKRIKKNEPPETGNNQSILPKKLLGIGERIQRAAVQLGGSTPVLKSPAELPPLQELLLKLSLAAKDPMNGYSMLFPFSRFFCDFRNSTSLENVELHDLEEPVLSEDPEGEKNTSIGKLDTVVAINPNTEKQEEGSTVMQSESEYPHVDDVKEKVSEVMESESDDPSGHGDVKEKGSEVMESESDDPSGHGDGKQKGSEVMELESDDRSGHGDVKEKGSEAMESESDDPSGDGDGKQKGSEVMELESDDPSGHGDVKEKGSEVMESESDDPSGLVDGKAEEESSPTALILNFQDSKSVPLGADLNKIFSRFGPLDESQTEGLGKTKCAKVVFKRRSDAETAFSSAGKYSTFGPSLISYRLHYFPTPPDSSRL